MAVKRNNEGCNRPVRTRQTLIEFLQSSPLRDLKLELPKRLPEKMWESRYL